MTDAESSLRDELVESGLEPREARWLLEEFLPGGDPDGATALRAAAARRLAGEPLQYVLGHWPFRELDLDVDPRVLIPRPETEWLVEVALRELARANVRAPRLLDLGTGSGAIGLSMVSELAARGVAATLVATDESDDALAVARRNAVKHRVTSVSFVRSSWFEDLDASLRGSFDVIVANPPYVGAVTFSTLDPVLGHEPYGALVAPDDGALEGFGDLAIILAQAGAWLAPKGALVMEHGDEQREVVLTRARDAGFADVVDLDDLSGRPRVVVARR